MTRTCRRNALQLRFRRYWRNPRSKCFAHQRVFDVADPAEIAIALNFALADGADGRRLPGAFDGFELAMR